MLIRFVVDNLYSFGKAAEFNALPNGRLRTLSEHCYQLRDDLAVLKLSALYGANAAGKSNLARAIRLLQMLVTEDSSVALASSSKFKLERVDNKEEQVLAAEFAKDGKTYLYALKILAGRVSVEELYITHRNKEELVFERTTDENSLTDIRFSREFEASEKNMMLKSILIDEFVKPDQPVLKLLANRENEHLHHAKKAHSWFKNDLTVLQPDSKPAILAQRLESDKQFREFVQEVMRAFHMGISEVSVIRHPMDEFMGGSPEGKAIAEEFRRMTTTNGAAILQLDRVGAEDELLIVKENDDFFVKQLQIDHKKGCGDETARFGLPEESDGTVKLLHLLPAIFDVIRNKKVYVIDELERSIHPVLIKELVGKFSHFAESQGQLVFTTHESVLLDQKIFRQDEIWFAEKDENGCTDLYSLSDYKEHKTIDIRKGYLDGRYGAIPFLGNLRDLSWHSDDNTE